MSEKLELLSNKVAIVTGGASPRGIGKASAKLLAEHGARVAIFDLESGAAESSARDIGDNHMGLGCDVTNKSRCEAAVKQVLESYGRVDILLNNAGITQPLKVMDIAPENYRYWMPTCAVH